MVHHPVVTGAISDAMLAESEPARVAGDNFVEQRALEVLRATSQSGNAAPTSTVIGVHQ